MRSYLNSLSMLRSALLFALVAMMFGTAQAGEYVVKFKSSKSLMSMQIGTKSFNGLVTKDIHARGQLAKVKIEAASTKEEARKLAELMEHPEVEYVVENFYFHALEEDPDPEEDEEIVEQKKQWALEKIRASDAWQTTNDGDDIVVAVIDTGVDMDHEDLAANMWTNPNEIEGNGIDDDGNGYIDDVKGWDFFDKDNDPNDVVSSRNKGHGTHCAGIIGALNNDRGVSGITNKVKIMPVRFLGPNGSGDLMNGARSIDYAVQTGAKVISASWGAAVNEARSKPIIEAIKRAEKAGVLFVAAAANSGKSNDKTSVFPANTLTSNTISVAASDSNDKKPRWSNYGEGRVHVAAPGAAIMSTLPDNKYASLSGTSMATPLVAGLAALLISEAGDKDLSPADIKAILQVTGVKVPIETACNCRIDAANAVDHLNKDTFTVVPNAATIGIKKTQNFEVWGDAEGPFSYSVTNPKVATIDAQGLLTGLKKGKTQVIVKDKNGNTATTMDIRVGLSGAPRLCPFHPVKCFFVCIFSWKQPWCWWNRNKVNQSKLDATQLVFD